MKKKMTPSVATLRITSRCNRDCKCCFAPKNAPEMDILTLKKIFSFLVVNGVKAILLTGGEPLLRKDFPAIVREIKNLEMGIFLDTNADFFFRYRHLICQHVDTIGMPITFADGSWNEGNFENVLRALEFLAKAEKRPAIRVGTVVTKANIGQLDKIGDLIRNYPISIWKLYEFTPQEEVAIKHMRELEVTKKQFELATERVKSKFLHFFDVAISRREERNRAYFFIESDGRVAMPVDDMNICRLKTIGKIFDANIFDVWAEWVVKRSHLSNIEKTFRCKP